ncbi:MAG: hypothetical protein ACRER8_10280 [Pseudomonas sp.]|uniref:hypothetical protein n=1 Tax=Pseudomonas sp. TaxID=306 RepID=UPI003D6DD9C1
MNVKAIWLAWAGATIILIAMLALASQDIPYRGMWIYAFATVEAAVVLLGFVQLQRSTPLVRLFALGTLFWMVLMFVIGLLELVTR